MWSSGWRVLWRKSSWEERVGRRWRERLEKRRREKRSCRRRRTEPGVVVVSGVEVKKGVAVEVEEMVLRSWN